MIRKTLMIAALMMPVAAEAGPSASTKVYGATVEAGVTELEARYGRLTGGPDDGADALVLEVAHGFSKNLYGALVGNFEREAGGARRLSEVNVEVIAPIGKIKALNLDVAAYAEFAAVRGGPDALEGKILLEHRAGSFDSRLNLIAGRPFADGAPVEFAYAASADWAVAGEFRLGAAALGDLGDSDKVTTRAEHYIGPVAKFDIYPGIKHSEIEVETGYLFAVGSEARSRTDGQLRLLLEWETHF